jgi:hypothetical protein
LKEELSAKTTIFDPVLSHGFSTQLIEDIVNKCANLFTVSDILETCAIYSVGHALQILEIMQEVFLDIPNFDETISILSIDNNKLEHNCIQKILEDIELLSDESDEYSDEELYEVHDM